MKHLLIYNAHTYYKIEIVSRNWVEFIDKLNEHTMSYGRPPDLIYLITER